MILPAACMGIRDLRRMIRMLQVMRMSAAARLSRAAGKAGNQEPERIRSRGGGGEISDPEKTPGAFAEDAKEPVRL